MLFNHFKIMVRNMLKSKSYTALNISGLTLGITCALTIFLYVYDELTFDSHHANYNKIYRLNGAWQSMTDESSNAYPSVGFIIGEYLKKDFPEIENVVRIQAWTMNVEKPGTDEQFAEPVHRVEPGVFDVFTFLPVSGSRNQFLADHNSMVITRKMALKYFNRTDVIGETLTTLGFDTVNWKITGVVEDYPDNTHLKMDIMVRLKEPVNSEPDWFEYGYKTFFTLKPNMDIKPVEERIQFFTKPYVAAYEKEIGFTQTHSITPFSKIHLYSHLAGETNSQASTVYIFLVIGSFIMIMACINFMNLATARSLKRAKEIGIRKAVGAVKSQLVRQFLGEAFLITLLASVISLLAIHFILPTVNSYSGKNLVIFNNYIFWIIFCSIILLVSLLSGSYPSFILSSFKPSETLKSRPLASSQGSTLRQALVVFQFIVSVSLIAGTLIVMNHLKFLRNKELGFDKEHVILIRYATGAAKEQLLNLAGVTHASFSNKVPGKGNTGRTIINGWDKSDPQVVMDQVVVDYDYIDLYKLQLLEGRGFDKANAADLTEAFIINESALGKLGYKSAKEAIDGKLWLDEDWGGKKGKIIGVLKDFHFNGVNSPILPFSMFLHPYAKQTLSVKIASSDIQNVLRQIEEIYKATVPNRAFEYSFLDEDFDHQYQAEDRFMSIFTFFAVIGISIGCLGLYGLAMFMAEQRTKEVGIRKVLGASAKSIWKLLTTDFLKLIAISFVIAVPITYFSMEQWLNKFPYREKISPLLFVSTGIVIVLITLLTVSYQALKTAVSNPVKALRAD